MKSVNLLLNMSSSDVTDSVTDTIEEAADLTVKNAGILRDYIDETLPKLLAFGVKIIIAVIVFVIGIRIINLIRGHFKKQFEKAGMDMGVVHFLDSLFKVILYFILFLLIFMQFGVTTASVVAILGSSGLTLGLALQGSLANFAGGVLILAQKPFSVGDYIKEDTHGNEGVVQKITITYTTLTTVDKKTVVVPNGTLANSSLTNYNAQTHRRVDVCVGIAYNADLKKAKDILFDIAKSCEYLDGDDIDVFVSDLSESQVSLGLRFSVKSADYWSARWDTLEKIKLRFDEEGIEIPFPQLTVSYLDKQE